MWKGALAGAAAGLAASWVMERFQAELGKLSNGGGEQAQESSEPATNKAADAIAMSLTGHEVPNEYKSAAGSLVHYAMGGATGALYGAVAERKRDVTAWAGLPFGAAVWLLADEIAVPAVGLAKGPTSYPASTHAYALASHLVYGAAAESVRRGLRALLR
jgi:uncharacterized membrane protein YagU involved in acid resistance